MIAVYYNTSSAPYSMFVIDIVDSEHHTFLDTLEKENYPYPEEGSDVLFIENERVIDQFNFSENDWIVSE